MTPTPHVQPLSYRKRQVLLGLLFLVFLVLLPALMFYATGYRFNFADDEGMIVNSTGGLYVSAPRSDMEIFVDEEPVRNLRVFRRASFIQNLEAGIHRLNVQHEDLQTWTKDLPVYPHIVTEAQSFNLPQVPRARVITEYLTAARLPVIMYGSGTTTILKNATTTNDSFYYATNSATTTYTLNPEYEFVSSLFGTTSTSTRTILTRVVEEVESAFNFATSLSTTSTSTIATTTKINRDMMLYDKNGEVYAKWVGQLSDIPYYFCVDHVSASTTIARYGEHVFESIAPIIASGTEDYIRSQNNRTRVCRDEIRIDRLWQDVYDFDFLPESTDHVLMLLTDGLYVVEIDDRAWQNTQLLYPGTDLHMQVEGGEIYVFDGSYYLEALTEIE